jgi:hypothetical protein
LAIFTRAICGRCFAGFSCIARRSETVPTTLLKVCFKSRKRGH